MAPGVFLLPVSNENTVRFYSYTNNVKIELKIHDQQNGVPETRVTKHDRID
jgi:hypothetical protein